MYVVMLRKREIGSEFWDIPQSEESRLFSDRTAWFLSGRWALDFVLEDLLLDFTGPRTAALPSWCCETMVEPFLRHGFEVRFYSVLPGPDGGLVMNFSQMAGCGVLLAMDYFGYTREPLPPGFAGTVIRDVTHSLFSTSPVNGDCVFGSLRKWAGFWTGGWAWKRGGAFRLPPPESAGEGYISLRRRAMAEKREYLEGRRADKGFLELFAQAEEILHEGIAGRGGAAEDIAAASRLDVDLLRRKRRENAAVLLKGVAPMALFPQIGDGDCPLFVPILVPGGKRNALRRYLIEREIYCPVHWPLSSIHSVTEAERRIYEEELSLVCDQRYGPEDMARTLGVIGSFFKGEQ